MGVKAVARTGLLVFVGVSVVALIVKSLAPAPDNPAEYADPPSDGILVTYFLLEYPLRGLPRDRGAIAPSPDGGIPG